MNHPRLRSFLAVCGTASLFATPIVALSTPAAAQEQYDVIIRNGHVLDGTGAAAYRADVAINGDRIAAIGDLSEATAEKRISARGLYVAPGFIDRHSHADPTRPRPHLAQGITTQGVNTDGGGPVDLVEQRESLLEDGIGVNVMQMVPHGSIREQVIGLQDRAPTAKEMKRMKELVRQGMEAGGFGLSSGLFYVPGFYAETQELVELAKVVTPYSGAYASHIRDESNYNIGVVDAVKEVIEIAGKANIPGVVTHIKALGPPVWGKSEAIIDTIERAKARGVEMYADQYPYRASATSIVSSLIPRWAQEGGREALLRRLEDPDKLYRIRAGIRENLERRGGPERLQFREFQPDPSFQGKTLQQYIDAKGLMPVDAVVNIVKAGNPPVISFNMNRLDVRAFMRQPWTMVSSDASLGHPRYYGTFTRVIRKYVLEEGTLTFPEAIHKMTGLPADVYDLEDRGVLREGNYADIVVFDLNRVQDVATFDNPRRLSRGMEHVLVNGQVVRENGNFTGALTAGRVLRHEAPEQKVDASVTAEFDSDNAGVGEKVTNTATVTNTGDKELDQVTVTFHPADRLTGHDTRRVLKQIRGLSPGETAKVSATYAAGTAGNVAQRVRISVPRDQHNKVLSSTDASNLTTE